MTQVTPPLRGTFTALVTPMNADLSVDFGALDTLVDLQLEAGITGLVPCGTTGESVTMSADERFKVISRVVSRVNGRVPVIAGAGSNSTAIAIEHQKRARDTGAQYALVVTPFYNKPTPEGLYRHYSALLESTEIPIILYNVPGRTGCDMKPETVARLSKLEGVVALKEATGDLTRLESLRAQTPTDFILTSGDDGTSSSFNLLGGDGVISVASNVVPGPMVELTNLSLEGDTEASIQLEKKLNSLFDVLFIESNPIPVKTALELQGHLEAHMRLPLCEMEPHNRNTLIEVLQAGKWI